MLGPISSLQTGTESTGADQAALLARHRSRGWHRRGAALVLPVIFSVLSLALAASASASFVPQATLSASDEIGKSRLGSSVALSSDGKIALLGGPSDNEDHGAVWVFTRRGSNWTEQAKLTGGGEIGEGRFGTSVSLSADGRTALIGGPGDDEGIGAAWVFTRTGSTWTQQGEKLTGSGEVGRGGFGASVALSSHGKTALIGGPNDNHNFSYPSSGAAWVFTRSGSTWTQQGPKLVVEYGGGELERFEVGARVALSGDGNTALIEGKVVSGTAHGPGIAWVFTRSGSTWTEGPGLRNAEDIFHELGAIALSSDGNTVLIGGSYSNFGFSPGAAWVFTGSGATWTQQGPGLTSGSEAFGGNVALSSDGNVALIEDYPGVWVFKRTGSTWTQQFPPLACAGDGCDVALSGNAGTALVGTAVYVNAPARK